LADYPDMDEKNMKVSDSSVKSCPSISTIVLIFFALILIAVAFAWGKIFQGSELNQHIGQSITQIGSALFFVFVIWRFGWLRASGFAAVGRGRTWLLVTFPFIYVLAKDIYLTTGEFSFELTDPASIFWPGLSGLTAGLLEETVFRGIILFYFLRLWGRAKSGLTKSLFIAALLFGGIQLLRLAENPWPQTLLDMLTASLTGFFYGVVLLHGQSIWIPIVFHGLHDAVVNLNMVGKNVVETPRLSVFMLLTTIPVFLFGIYLLKKIPRCAGPVEVERYF
jgi:membrane protease YdiL (CAAX protease family)